MTPLQFEHALNERTLRVRQSLNRAAQCMNMAHDSLERALIASRKSSLRLAASIIRLQRCLEAHGYE
jgi:hypothetical protein